MTFRGVLYTVSGQTYGLMIESYQTWLVVSTRLKNMKVTLDDYSQYMAK